MVNIIYGEDKNMRFTQFDKNIIYDLTDLRFFINNNKSLLVLYCIIKNSNGTLDSVKLQIGNSESKGYDCYNFSPTQLLSLNSGVSTLFLFGIYTDKSTFITDEFDMNLNVENFKISNKLYVVNELENDVMNYYNKIEQLTKMNIDMFKDIQEIKNGGEVI